MVGCAFIQQELDNPCNWPDGRAETIRERYGPAPLNMDATPIPSICCLHTIACTQDGFIVAARRSENVEYYPRTWAVSFEENLSEDDLNYGDAALFRAVKRGGDEEFFERGADVIDQRTVRLLSIFNQVDLLSWTVCACVDFPLSLSELRKRLPHARDKESRIIAGIPNDLQEVCSHIVRPRVCDWEKFKLAPVLTISTTNIRVL